MVIDGNKGDYNAGITVEGVGKDAAVKFGIMFKGSHYAEIRNIASIENKSAKDDAIGFEQDNDYVWSHNNDIFYGADRGGDKAKGDGSLDTKSTDHITHSYNHFWDSGKANLLGMGKDEGHFATFHHNWYDHSDSRHPRVRHYTTHVYNNYYDGIAKYGIASAEGAPSIFAENNYFRNANYPFITGGQGHDIQSDGGSTVSGEPGGIIKAYGNEFEGGNFSTSYQEDSTNFDYYQASSRDEKISSNVKGKGGAYNNFDTAADFYKYNVQTALEAKTEVENYSGRVENGDIWYEFDDATEDRNYVRIPELDKILTSYESKLQKAGLGSDNSFVVGGEGGGSTTPVDPEPDPAKEYKITLDANGGELPADSQTSFVKTQGEALGELPTPTNANGFTFAGWYNGTTKVDANTKVASNMTLVAKWIDPNAPVATMEKVFSDANSDENFTITGNMDSRTYNVSYGDKTFTKGMKVESSTNITFTTSSKMKLVLVASLQDGSAPNGKSIKVDGKKQTFNDFVVEIEIEAGSHTITKGDTMTLLYISLTPIN